MSDLTKCEDCNRPYGNEFGFPDLVVPHGAWESIMPGRGGGGMLCPSCMCKRAHDVGIECKASFRSGPFFESDAAKDAETSAAVAAALGEAAQRMDAGFFSYNAGNRVRALITPDATAAIDRDRARVRQEAIALMARIERCDFECEAGPLSMCQDWINLKTMMEAADGN